MVFFGNKWARTHPTSRNIEREFGLILEGQCPPLQENKYGIATFNTCIGLEALEVYNDLPFEREENKQMVRKLTHSLMPFTPKWHVGQQRVLSTSGGPLP